MNFNVKNFFWIWIVLNVQNKKAKLTQRKDGTENSRE